MLQGFALIDGLPASLPLSAHVAKMLALRPDANIKYVDESYGYLFDCNDTGRALLKGVAAAGKADFAG